MVNNDILTNVSILTIAAFVFSYFVYYISKDKEWVIFNFYIFAAALTSLLLLKYNSYILFTTVTLLLMLFAVFFLFFKVDLNYSFSKVSGESSFYNNLKNNISNTNLFFWILFISSFITILGLIFANRAGYVMSYKESPKGPVGENGEIGRTGISQYLSSRTEIAYTHMLDAFNTEIQKQKPEYALNNLFIKEHIKDICNSLDFKKELLTISNSQDYSSQENDAFAFKNLVDTLVLYSTFWAKRFLLYKKGADFLNSPFLNRNNWDLMYVPNDKENNLNPDFNQEMIKISTRWKWNTKCNN